MSSDWDRISLEVLHRHIVVTHLKDRAAGVHEDLQRQASQSGEPLGRLLAECVKLHYPKRTDFQDDNWYVGEVPLDRCYFAHEDFRTYPVPKGERFVDFMHDKRQAIESGLFPYSSQICAPWPGPMPEPLAQEREEPEKYYILDGQLRVIWHWYHNVPNVRMFIYREKCKL